MLHSWMWCEEKREERREKSLLVVASMQVGRCIARCGVMFMVVAFMQIGSCIAMCGVMFIVVASM